MEQKAKPVFEWDKALEMVDGDKEFLKELVEIFISDYPQKLTKIYQAIKEKDFKAISEAAHSLKGASGNLSLARVYKLSFELEKMAKDRVLKDIGKVYQDLKEELEKFKEFTSRPRWEEK
ncbi:hypothetical protein CVT91_11420 [Candidatus Atribacteria bacterium HGW-Atribacteria-1]|nr:MAG: hypothetical protein CVT91_11420 [Candidatus Atribacteria bacterium HGW-Atribacteria-1]